MENWDDKLIITTAPKVEIHGFDEDDLISYDEAMAFIQNEPETKSQPSRIAPDVIGAVKAATGMTVTDGIDLVALLIENDLCSDETPEHIKCDLRVLAQIIKRIQMIYPFTESSEVVDIEHRKYMACDGVKLISEGIREIFTETKNGKYHTTRTEKAEAQS